MRIPHYSANFYLTLINGVLISKRDSTSHIAQALQSNTVEPLNNGHGGDEHFVHCSEVVPLSEVEMYGQLMEGGKQFVHCREVVLLSECPLSEVLLY